MNSKTTNKQKTNTQNKQTFEGHPGSRASPLPGVGCRGRGVERAAAKTA